MKAIGSSSFGGVAFVYPFVSPFSDKTLEAEFLSRSAASTAVFFYNFGVVHVLATCIWYLWQFATGVEFLSQPSSHIGHFVRLVGIGLCCLLSSTRCCAMRPVAIMICAVVLCVVCAGTWTLENPEVQFVHMAPSSLDLTQVDFPLQATTDAMWKGFRERLPSPIFMTIEEAMVGHTQSVPFRCAWEHHGLDEYNWSEGFDLCALSLRFAPSFTFGQLILLGFGVFSHMPSLFFLVALATSDVVIFAVLAHFRAASLSFQFSWVLLSSLVFFVFSLYSAAIADMLRRSLFLLEKQALTQGKQSEAARLEFERLGKSSWIYGSSGMISAIRMSKALEDRQGRAVLPADGPSSDAVIRVAIEEASLKAGKIQAQSVRFRPRSSEREKLEVFLGNKPPKYFEELLAPGTDAALWEEYVQRCSTALSDHVKLPEKIHLRLRWGQEIQATLVLKASGSSSATLSLSSVCGNRNGKIAAASIVPLAKPPPVSASAFLEQGAGITPASARLISPQDFSFKDRSDGSCNSSSLSKTTLCEEGDCLSPEALVWIQGRESPVPLADVRAGMQVLAFDPLQSPPMAYAPVHAVETKEGEGAGWVKVQMADGTEALMTADHPVWPQSTTRGSAMPAIRAADLMAGVDALITVAPRPVRVQSVTHVASTDAPPARVRLELGARPGANASDAPRSVLVSQPDEGGGGGYGGFVALGDARGQPAATRLDALCEANGVAVQEVNTFVSVGAGDRGYALRRCDSDPGLLSLRRCDSDSESVAGLILSSYDRSGISVSSGACGSSRDQSKGHSDSSGLSTLSVEGQERQVHVGAQPVWTHHSGANGGAWIRNSPDDVTDQERCVKLSQFAALPRLPDGRAASMGSIGHVLHNESCKVCVFSRKPSESRCRWGAACDFCHAEHAPYVRPSRQQRRLRALSVLAPANAAVGDATSEPHGDTAGANHVGALSSI